MDYFIGHIILTVYDFEQKGMFKCEGQELNIAEHEALFSLVGTKFGGDGIKTFKLPDLRDQVPHTGLSYQIVDYGLYPARQ